jgi:uncharacterized protein with HEPN domain
MARGLEIISEASRHVPQALKALAPNIPWRRIAAIGHLPRREDRRADTKSIWNIIGQHLAPLAIAIEPLVMEAERRERG